MMGALKLQRDNRVAVAASTSHCQNTEFGDLIYVLKAVKWASNHRIKPRFSV